MRTIEIIAEVTGSSREVSTGNNVYYKVTFDTLGTIIDDVLSTSKLQLVSKGISRPLSLLRVSSNDGDRSQYGTYEIFCKNIVEYGNVVRLVVEEHIIGVTEYIDSNNTICKHGAKLLADKKAVIGDVQYELKEAYQIGNSELYRVHSKLNIETPISILQAGISRAINKQSNQWGE